MPKIAIKIARYVLPDSYFETISIAPNYHAAISWSHYVSNYFKVTKVIEQ